MEQPTPVPNTRVSVVAGNRNYRLRRYRWPGMRLLWGLASTLLMSTSIPQPLNAQEGLQDYDHWAGLCQSLTQQQQYDEALKACDQAIALNTNDPQTWTDRSMIVFAQAKHSDAVAAFNQVLKLKPDEPKILAKRCISHFKLQNYEPALKDCELALQVADQRGQSLPDQAWYYRSAALFKLERLEEALAAYDWATHIHRRDGRAWADRCQVLAALKQYSLAFQSCDRALQGDSDWGDSSPAIGWSQLAQLHRQLGDYNQALKGYDKALAFAPKDPQLWSQQGILLDQLGEHQQAQASHGFAVTLAPTSSAALIQQCANANQLRQFETALASCEKAFQEGDGDWGEAGLDFAWSQRGTALIGLGRFEEALTSIDRALALTPKDAHSWSARALSLWRLGRFDEALDAAVQGVEVDPQSSLAWFNQGRILTTLGKLEEAVAAYDQALKGDANAGKQPTLVEIWINQSAAYWRLEDYSLALSAADQAIALDAKSDRAWYNKALALMGLRAYSRAVTAYNKALAFNEKSADYWTGKGIALKALGKFPDALASLEQALSLNPNHSLALLNQEQVKKQIQPSK